MPKAGGSRHVILSGCSGGGKSTLLHELARRGFGTVEEPGRRIVAEALLTGGKALPWVDLAAFARRALEMASADREGIKAEEGWVFFDRGLVDAAVALEFASGVAVARSLAGQSRFHRQVFLTPPWPEIYLKDAERQQDLGEGIREYGRLEAAYGALGYERVVLPKTDVRERADFILALLAAQG